ncbi:MAG: M13 family metallopeptidase, partial [Ferruginibacter sp.]
MKSTLIALVVLMGQTAVAQQPAKFIDPSNMDLSVKPGDNFYLYVNGNWIKNTPVPASKTRWGTFDQLADESSNALKGLLQDASTYKGSNSLMKRIGDFYASGMDSVRIEKLGYQPIKPFLNKINEIKNKEGVMKIVGYLRSNAVASPLINVGVGQDARLAYKYVVGISQGGISLPDRDYYLKEDARSKEARAALKKYIIDLFTLTGTDAEDAEQKANEILKMETSIASAQLSRVDMRDPVKMYNKMTLNELISKSPHLDWPAFFKTLGYNSTIDTVVVSQPAFVSFTDSLLENISLGAWKTYLQWNVLRDNAANLSSKFVNANFDYNKVLTGQKVQTPRWERMSRLIDRQLGELLGQLYVQKYFKPEAKKRMHELVANMERTYEVRIKKLDWMTDATKLKALEKLHTYINKIGYPDVWKDYKGVVINRNDFLANVKSAAKWQYDDRLSKLNKPVDKTEWGMTPPTVNAYYSPQKNEIV